MTDWFVIVLAAGIAFFVGAGVGNREADQATLRDCAVQGQASMMGGGVITCEVKKEAMK